MTQTRSGKDVNAASAQTEQLGQPEQPEQPEQEPSAAGSKRKGPPKSDAGTDQTEDEEDTDTSQAQPGTVKEPPTKSQRPNEDTQSNSVDQDKLDKIMSTYGRLPLSDVGLSEPEKPTAETLLAHLFNAMLTSARISHQLASKSVKCMIEAGYHDIQRLESSSWEERTEVLTKGGYTRYREKTATGLGDLVNFLTSKYDGDLNKLREAGKDDPDTIRSLVKEIKGFGEVGVNIFSDTVQSIWPCMAPYVDPRSFETAESLGIGSDVKAMWKGVGEDPRKMATLCQALTSVRLDKKQEEFED